MVFACVNYLEGPGGPGPVQLVAIIYYYVIWGNNGCLRDDVLETQILLNSTTLHSNNHNKLHRVKTRLSLAH